MPGRRPTMRRPHLIQDFGQVARARSQVEDRGVDRQEVVDLAGMHQPHKSVPHSDHLQVRRRKGSGQFAQRLIGQTQHIPQPALSPGGFDLPELASPAHKTKHQTGIPCQLLRCLQQGVQGMTRAMIPGIHHHKLLLQTMSPPESFPPLPIEPHLIILGPRRDHGNLPARNALGRDPFRS